MSTSILTGLLWSATNTLTSQQLADIKHSYTYPNPHEPNKTFSTFIELPDRIGIPFGDQQKALSLLNNPEIEDRTIENPFDNLIKFKGPPLRDYQEDAFKEVEEYIKHGGTCWNLAGKPGCVDKDTEFLTRNGWKPISEFVTDDEVLEWNPDGSTVFNKPHEYIKEPAENLLRIKTTTIDMVLSEEHKVPYISSKGNFNVAPASNIIKLSSIKIPRTFTAPSNTIGINIPNELIRVLIMQAADGHILSIKSGFKIRINVKKPRKKLRVIKLLEEASIPYKIYKNRRNYLQVVYYPPFEIAMKSLELLWNANAEQLRIAYEELFLWDGCLSTKSFSGSKADVDVAQFIMSTISGNYCSISKDNREYKFGSVYTCTESTRATSTINLNIREIGKPDPKGTYNTEDGFKYCFTTSTGFWVARRNGKIFPTGNSGKSFMLAYMLSRLKTKTLIIAHLSMLTDQIHSELTGNLDADIRILNAKNLELGDINIATSQFISKRPELWKQIKHQVGFIVVDESESAASETTLRILQRAHAKYRMFISATFSRSVDGRTEALKDLAGHKSIVLERKDLLRPTIIGVECPEYFRAPQMKHLYKRAQVDFYKNHYSIDDKVTMVTKASLQKDRQVLIVTDLIELQERYKSQLDSIGISSGILNGSVKAKERKRILEEYDSGNIKVLIGASVLNAGLSIPKISVIIRVSFANSAEKLTQLIGRSLRDYEGKQGAWFIDLQFTQGVYKREKLYHSSDYTYVKTTWDKFKEKL